MLKCISHSQPFNLDAVACLGFSELYWFGNVFYFFVENYTFLICPSFNLTCISQEMDTMSFGAATFRRMSVIKINLISSIRRSSLEEMKWLGHHDTIDLDTETDKSVIMNSSISQFMKLYIQHCIGLIYMDRMVNNYLKMTFKWSTDDSQKRYHDSWIFYERGEPYTRKSFGDTVHT